MKDLPEVSWSGISDLYERFEASLPFNRTLITVMMAKIDEANEECGGKGYFSIQALRKALTSPAWADLVAPESSLHKSLRSEYFKCSPQDPTSA
jgi:hypothetical protein